MCMCVGGGVGVGVGGVGVGGERVSESVWVGGGVMTGTRKKGGGKVRWLVQRKAVLLMNIILEASGYYVSCVYLVFWGYTVLYPWLYLVTLKHNEYMYYFTFT